VKLPLRITGRVLLKGLDAALTLAIRLNHWLDKRQASRKAQPLPDDEARRERAVRKTVILRKK
jgi:hypothetical protein